MHAPFNAQFTRRTVRVVVQVICSVLINYASDVNSRDNNHIIPRSSIFSVHCFETNVFLRSVCIFNISTDRTPPDDAQ